MRHLLKTFLVCLLAVALLGQGITAMASVSCGPRSSHAAAAHADGGDDGHAHRHRAATSEHDASSDVLQAMHGHCSICAACCFGPAPLAGDVRWDAAIGVARAVGVSAHSPYSDYLPAALERPPRLQ